MGITQIKFDSGESIYFRKEGPKECRLEELSIGGLFEVNGYNTLGTLIKINNSSIFNCLSLSDLTCYTANPETIVSMLGKIEMTETTSEEMSKATSEHKNYFKYLKGVTDAESCSENEIL